MAMPSIRVLLVEDSISGARLLQRRLHAISSEPLDITHVTALDEALTRLNDKAFDVALLDLSASFSNGADAIRRIRCRESRIPIVGLTAPGEEMPEIERIRDDSALDFILEKQNDPQAISRAIRYAVRLKRAEDFLRESEERFRLACEAFHAMVYDVDARTGCVILVHGLPSLLGYDPGKEPQNRDWWFAQIHKDDIPRVLQQLQAFRSKGNDYALQYRIRHRDGTYIVVEDSGRNIPDETGRAVRTIGSVVDVTQRKQAEDALRQSEQRYQELVEELEQMVEQRTADLEQRSLQLRTLTAELTHAEERERTRLAQAIHDDLQQLLVGARFCAETLAVSIKEDLQETMQRLNQFLNEAIESARSLTFELSPPILHSAGLARSLHYLARQMETKHGLKVEIQADEQAEPEIEGLKVLLFQATRELLFNIVKHAQVKNAEVEVQRLKGNLLQITVSDSGIGFDPEKCAAEDDHGFGLFSIRGRLDLIGGCLEIKSAPGAGSRCTITAPLRKLKAAERAAWEAASGGVQGTKPRGGMVRAGRKIRVLIADDHTIMRQGLMQLLQGHKDIAVVGEAVDGQEALELAPQLNPDVIILQGNMSRIEGIETTLQLKREFPQIKVIGLSAGEEPELGAAMRKAGAFAFFNKANRLESLVATIRDSFSGAA
jgi:PAS domain S-box-containing protein